jgi:ubiquinone/menaquinone biosynthesis C-methylase UbiE
MWRLSLMIASLYNRLLSSALRLFFKLLYHQFSWSYNFVAAVVSGGRWIGWVHSVLPYLQGPRVLELGHGPGHLLLAMQRKGLKAVGLDESHGMGVLVVKGMLGFGFDLLVVNGYAQYMPFPNNHFNQIVSTFPSEFILDPRTLSEAYRVLAPDGELIILPSASITGKGWYDRLAAWLFHFTGQAPDWDSHFTGAIQKAGFQVGVETLERQSDCLLIIKAKKHDN